MKFSDASRVAVKRVKMARNTTGIVLRAARASIERSGAKRVGPEHADAC